MAVGVVGKGLHCYTFDPKTVDLYLYIGSFSPKTVDLNINSLIFENHCSCVISNSLESSYSQQTSKQANKQADTTVSSLQ